jgi:hypothetical protein
LFAALSHPALFADAFRDLCDYYAADRPGPPPAIDPDLACQFLVPLCVSDPPSLECGLLLLSILAADCAHSLLLALIGARLHEPLYERLPRGATCDLLAHLLARSEEIRRWSLRPHVNVFRKIAPCLQSPTPDTPAAVRLFAVCPDDADHDPRFALERLADLAFSATDAELATACFVALDGWARRSSEFCEIIGNHPRFSEFVARMIGADRSELLFFLWFIGSAFQKRSPGLKDKMGFIAFLIGLLNSADAEVAENAAFALSSVIAQEDVGRCLSAGIWDLLAAGLEQHDPFPTKMEFLRVMCRLVALSSLEEASALVGCGFFEVFETYGEAMMTAIPENAADALAQLDYHAETNGIEDWLARIFSDDTVELLHRVCDRTSRGSPAYFVVDGLVQRCPA